MPAVARRIAAYTFIEIGGLRVRAHTVKLIEKARRSKLAPAVATALPLFAVAGCARCRPTTIVVAEKDQTVRLDTGPSIVRPTETGRMEEVVRPQLNREYWVKSLDGRWHRVDLEQYRAAEVGSSVQVCE